MGMYLELAPVSETTIARLHADPALAMQIFEPDDPHAADRVRPKPKGPGLVGRLLGRKPPPPPPPPEPLVLKPGEGEVVNIDKAWQAAHYLLTGSQWEGDPPLNFLLAGGTDLDADWLGDTPPRTFSPEETRAIAEALAGLGEDELGVALRSGADDGTGDLSRDLGQGAGAGRGPARVGAGCGARRADGGERDDGAGVRAAGVAGIDV